MSFSTALKTTILCGAVFASCTAAANAQILAEGESWADIARPEYDPLGIPVGGFDLFPFVEASAAYNSNVFAAPTAELDDLLLTIRPSLSLQSTWSRHQLRAAAFVESAFYTSLSGEDHTDFGVNVDGFLDVSGQTRMFADVGYASRHENRNIIDTVRDTIAPIQFENLRFNAGILHQFNNLEVELRGLFSDFNADDGISSLGAVVDQDFRDNQVYSGELTVSYEFSPGYSAFASVKYDDFSFDFGPTDPTFIDGVDLVRDYSVLRLDAGVTAEVTEVLYATLGVGRLTSYFDDPIFEDFSALSLRADILWNVTTLSSIVATASRSTQTNANNFNAVARLDTVFEVGFDHELLYNVIVIARANYGSFNFQGADRTDDQYGGRIEARYLFNNQWRAQIEYRFDKRNSDDFDFNFTRHIVSAGVRFAF